VRVLTKADLLMLGHFCNQHAEIVRLYRLRKQGLPTPAPTAAQYSQLRMFADEFGFTPASRSKAQPAGGQESQNPFQQLTGS
jgi:phage terminase small subunit